MYGLECRNTFIIAHPKMNVQWGRLRNFESVRLRGNGPGFLSAEVFKKRLEFDPAGFQCPLSMLE